MTLLLVQTGPFIQDLQLVMKFKKKTLNQEDVVSSKANIIQVTHQSYNSLKISCLNLSGTTSTYYTSVPVAVLHKTCQCCLISQEKMSKLRGCIFTRTVAHLTTSVRLLIHHFITTLSFDKDFSEHGSLMVMRETAGRRVSVTAPAQWQVRRRMYATENTTFHQFVINLAFIEPF